MIYNGHWKKKQKDYNFKNVQYFKTSTLAIYNRCISRGSYSYGFLMFNIDNKWIFEYQFSKIYEFWEKISQFQEKYFHDQYHIQTKLISKPRWVLLINWFAKCLCKICLVYDGQDKNYSCCLMRQDKDKIRFWKIEILWF